MTRATVYRHFPDEEALFVACSSQWLARQKLPTPQAWTVHDDPLERLRVGLTDVYRYYRSGEQMLSNIHRDAQSVPQRVRETRIQTQRQWVDRLAEPFSQPRSMTMQAAVGHAVAFQTWRSLCVDHHLSNRSAVELMVGMVSAAQGRSLPRQAARGTAPRRR